MSSSYPASLDNLNATKSNSTAQVTDHPGHHNDLANALNAVEATLGVNPQGAAASVAARIAGLSALDIVNADVNAAAAIAESKLALASDAAAGTASRRTLGTSATSAAAGNDARLSDTRTPTDNSVTAAKVNTAIKGGPAAAVEALRALGATSTTAAAGNDSRLSDARAPTAHKTSHEPGGSDAMAVDAVAATGSLRTLGTSATSATAGNDARLSDVRTPSDDSVTTAKINTAIKGGAAAGTEALRAIGSTATTAAAGNDARLSDSRAPNGSAGGVLTGTYPNPTLASVAWTEVLGGVGFANSWVNYGSGYSTAAYRKLGANVVQIKGFIKTGTIGLTAFTLPAGLRPPEALRFGTVSNDLFGAVDIGTGGDVKPTVGNNTWLSIDHTFGV